MMATKTISALILLFLVTLICMASTYVYKVLDLMSAI